MASSQRPVVLRRDLLRAMAAVAVAPPRYRRFAFGQTATIDFAPLHGANFIYGQSNAGLGGTTPATLRGALAPATAVMFAGGPSEGGSPTNTNAIVPLRNPPNHTLSVGVAAAFALDRYLVDEGHSPPRMLWDIVADGGAPIAAFEKGSVTYRRLLAAVSRLNGLSIQNDIPPVLSVTWIQGETTSPNYAADLTRLIRDLIPNIQEATGQTYAPQFIVFQINNNLAFNNFNQIPLDQLAISQTTPHVTLAGPMYYTPLELIPGPRITGIHGTELGRMMCGEILALCYKTLLIDNQAWRPLKPVSLTRDDAVIQISFTRPTGGGKLAWDTSWIGPTANYGFFYADDTASAEIASVALGADGASVIIRLSRAPTGTNKKVLYAIGPGRQTVMSPWPAVRGQLISPTRQPSAYHRMGYPTPEFVTHYAVRFVEHVP